MRWVIMKTAVVSLVVYSFWDSIPMEKITSVLLKTLLFEAISTDLKCVSFFTNLSTIKLLSLSLSLIFLPSSIIYPSVKLKKLWVDFLERGGQGRMTNINDDVLKSFKLIVVPMYTQYLSS